MKNLCAALLLCCASAVCAQTTAFTYQGKLTDNGNPANGNFELQFKMFDTPTVGTGVQQGGTLVRDPVSVSAGVFTVALDFGANVFSGADRYLEIALRPDGSGGAFTLLATRQPVTVSPYAIQTLNSASLGELPANRYLASAANGNFGVNTANPTGGRLHAEGGTANAIYGHSVSGVGVYGTSTSYEGMRGEAADVAHGAIVGIHSGGGIGVFGSSTGAGVQGSSDAGRGVVGASNTGTGVYGVSTGVGITTPGVYGLNNSVGGIGVIGEANSATSIGVFGVSANASSYGVYARNLAGGRAIYAEGHVTQELNRGGVVKAMWATGGFNANNRCFNSQIPSTTVPCGFTVTAPAEGIIRIDFGFKVDDRFILVTPTYACCGVINSNNKGANYRFLSANVLDVFTFETNSEDTTTGGFSIVVF